MDASLIAIAVVGRVSLHRRAGARATAREIDRITELGIAGSRRGTH